MFSIEEGSLVLEDLRHCGWRFILFQDSGVSHTYLINNDVASSLLLNLPFFSSLPTGRRSSWKLIQHARLIKLPNLFSLSSHHYSAQPSQPSTTSRLSPRPSTSIPRSSAALHTSVSTSLHPSIRPHASPLPSSAWRASHSVWANWL